MKSKDKNMALLYKARADHSKWLNSIKLLVSGFSIDKSNKLPILQDSMVGKWLYSHAMQFSRFNSGQTLSEIETILETLYDDYAKIHAIYFQEKKSFFGSKKSVSHNEKELCRRYYEDMVLLSDQFKSKLNAFERQILALSDEMHETVTTVEVAKEEPKKPIVKTEENGNNYNYGPRSR